LIGRNNTRFSALSAVATTTGHRWPPLFKTRPIPSGFALSKGRSGSLASSFDHCDHTDNDARTGVDGQGNRSPKRTDVGELNFQLGLFYEIKAFFERRSAWSDFFVLFKERLGCDGSR
jgi:hypothetical protein